MFFLLLPLCKCTTEPNLIPLLFLPHQKSSPWLSASNIVIWPTLQPFPSFTNLIYNDFPETLKCLTVSSNVILQEKSSLLIPFFLLTCLLGDTIASKLGIILNLSLLPYIFPHAEKIVPYFFVTLLLNAFCILCREFSFDVSPSWELPQQIQKSASDFEISL